MNTLQVEVLNFVHLSHSASCDEANDENLVVATKTEQVAIAKDQIDRIDYRPPKTGPKVTKETKTQVDPKLSPATAPHDAPGLSSSSSSTMSMGKPDFETIYRRLPAPSAK